MISPRFDFDAQLFLNEYWQQRPLLIKNALPNFQSPISPEELAGLAMEVEADSRIVSRLANQWQLEHGPFVDTDFLRDGEWSLLVQRVNEWFPEELRFGDRLQCCISADPHLLSQPVPRFLLQPLVENALKFGQASSAAPLQLQIELQRCGDALQLQVINSGRLGEPPAADGRGVGFGLDSLRQRLRLHYGSRASFSLQESDTTVSAVVHLPLSSR